MAHTGQIVLQNAERELVSLNLPHEFACTEEACSCVRVKQAITAHDRKTGAVSLMPRQVRVAGSITLTARGTPGDRATVPSSVRFAPDVAQRVARGKLIVSELPDAPASEPPVSSEPEATPSEASSEPSPTPSETEPSSTDEASAEVLTDSTSEPGAPSVEPKPNARKRSRE